MKKKGVSDLFVAILLVLLVIVLIVFLVLFFRSTLEREGGEIESAVSCFDVDLEIKKVEWVDREEKADSYLIWFERSRGKGKFAKIIVGIYGDKGKKNYAVGSYVSNELEYLSGIEVLESGFLIVPVPPDGLVGEKEKISLAPVLDIDGKEKICPESDFENIKDLEPIDNFPENIDEGWVDEEGNLNMELAIRCKLAEFEIKEDSKGYYSGYDSDSNYKSYVFAGLDLGDGFVASQKLKIVVKNSEETKEKTIDFPSDKLITEIFDIKSESLEVSPVIVYENEDDEKVEHVCSSRVKKADLVEKMCDKIRIHDARYYSGSERLNFKLDVGVDYDISIEKLWVDTLGGSANELVSIEGSGDDLNDQVPMTINEPIEDLPFFIKELGLSFTPDEIQVWPLIKFNVEGIELVSECNEFKKETSVDNSDLTWECFEFPTDVDGDGIVMVSDLHLVRGNLGRTGTKIIPPTADVNDDGIVNIIDLNTVKGDMGCGG